MSVPDKVRSVGKHVGSRNLLLTVVERVVLWSCAPIAVSVIKDSFNCKSSTDLDKLQ
jgi:hypothetical protein